MDAPPVQVHSVLFRPDGYLEVTYAEASEMSPAVNVVRTIVMERERFLIDIQDLEISIMELVDEGLLALRNPPDREPARTA